MTPPGIKPGDQIKRIWHVTTVPRSQLVTRVIRVCYKIQPYIIIEKEHGILYQFESKGCDKEIVMNV